MSDYKSNENNQKKINQDTNEEGYLLHFDQWNAEFAEKAAKLYRVSLSSEHWEIIYLLRETFQKTKLSPNTRSLVKLVKHNLGSDKGNSFYIMQLFTGNPALVASKISGLPKPKQCF